MTNFNSAYEFTRQHEGGYSNIPGDRGGETKYGISASIFSSAKKAGIIDSSLQSVKALTPDEAKTIYRRIFWNKIHGDELPGDLSIALFDTAVNIGVEKSVRLLQKILDVAPDGAMGPETLRAINHYDGDIVGDYLAARKLGY